MGVLCQSAFAALPGVEAPQSSGGSGIMGQFKGYLQDGIVLGGLLVAAIMFINVAIAAGHTFAEVRNERATWTKFGAIVVVGAILLVIIIWLLGKSANIIL
ncbi:membrane protein [Pectobacterium atrosepticum]|nr:membrane protein [Pectobacterium atrosepticum]KFX23984.1 membrane protein [Pectobacterium atrosepticum]